MTDWPPVIAMIITYERTPLALETIRSVKERVIYPNIGFHIADDGSNGSHVASLLSEIGASYSVEVTNAKRKGVGTNMNLGMEASLKRSNFILWLEDDWAIEKGQTLDLQPCVELLLEEKDIGMVRLATLPGSIEANSMKAVGKVWWRLKKGSDPYVMNGQASLRHVRFCNAYGLYPEGFTPGKTELMMCHHFDITKGPDIVWPAWLSTGQTFKHLGDSQSYKCLMEQEGKTAEQAAEIFKGRG